MVYEFNPEETFILINDFNLHLYKQCNRANRSWNSDAQHVLRSESNDRKVQLKEIDSGFALDRPIETITTANVY